MERKILLDSSLGRREWNKVSLEQPFWMLNTTILELKLSLFEKANLFKRFWFLIFESILRIFYARKNFAVIILWKLVSDFHLIS